MIDRVDLQDCNEKELIRKAVEGEASAFGVLYDRHHGAIYRFVYLRVGHREEAEDLTHHVFLSAWENMGAFQDEGLPITSWLYRIARNRVVDYYRTRRSHVDIDRVPEDLLGLSVDDSSQRLVRSMELAAIYKALSQLPQDQQDVVVMRFVNDLPYKEIAQAMQKNEGAVRVIQHRAMKALRSIISKNTTNEKA